MSDYTKFEVFVIAVAIVLCTAIVFGFLGYAAYRATESGPNETLKSEILRTQIESCNRIESIETRTLCIALVNVTANK